MKRITIYILSIALLAGACTRELDQPDIARTDDGKVRVDLSVSIPESSAATKALGETPAVQNLYLAVFDEFGFLVEYVKADADLATANDTRYNYSVALTLSQTPRIIHFIANAPENIGFGSEEEVMFGMTTSLYADAYWCRRVVSSIECVDPAATVLVPTDETKAALTDVPLTRNFAKIVLKTADGCPFALESYAVVNTPKVGTVAAYNRSTGEFLDYAGKTYEELVAEKYDGFVPVSPELNSDVDAVAQTLSSSPSYVYEKETPPMDDSSQPAWILAYGTYGGEKVYYKVDLRDTDGNYFPILRNFQYTVTINSVTREGYSTPSEAANSAGSGDISTSTETVSLTNISDGEVRLSVEYTEKVLVTDDDVTLDYNFETLGSAVLKKVTIRVDNDFGDSGAAIDGIVANGGVLGEHIENNIVSNQWYTLTVSPAAMGTAAKTQSIVLIAEYELNGKHETISRRVTYTLVPPYEMEIKCVPAEIPYPMGEAFDVEITIPDGLGKSMFPLAFSLEADDISMTPNNDHMPVATGMSIIPDVNHSSFWFVKSLTREEYDAIPALAGRKTFSCRFKTNKVHSTDDRTLVYAKNPYFVAAVEDIFADRTGLQPYDVDDLTYYQAQHFTDLAYSADPVSCGEDMEVTFSFMIDAVPTQGDITVTLTNLDAAEDESDLEFVRVTEDGKVVYSFRPSAANTTLSFDLVTTSFDGQPEVLLEAYRFVPASKTAARNWSYFDGNFSETVLPAEAGAEVDYTFNLPAFTAGMEVTVNLNGLVPTDMTDLTEKTNGVYIYTPAAGGSQTLHLKTTRSEKGTCSASLKAEGYKDDYDELTQENSIIIPALTVTFQISRVQNANAPDKDVHSPSFSPAVSYESMSSQKSNRTYTYTYTNVRIPADTQNVTITYSWSGLLSTYTYSKTVTVTTLTTNSTVTLTEQ